MYSLKRMCEKLTCGVSKKTLTLVLALTMILASTAGGTLAWLQAGSRKVTNTFAVGDISIDLAETDTQLDGDGSENTNLYEMNVGSVITKDPVVTVEAWSVDCWLFVELQESANFADFMEYAIAEGWTPVEGEARVFVRAVDQAGVDQTFDVLMDNQVAVKDNVTLADMAPLTPADYPTLSVTAYAVQRDTSASGINSADIAWQTVQQQTGRTVHESQ